MYFPYLRGRQYELLALKELCKGDLIGEDVVPVVEFMKESSTLTGTLRVFQEKNQTLALIINPDVGESSKSLDHVSNLLHWFTESECFIPAVVASDSLEDTLDLLEEVGIGKDKVMVVLANPDYVSEYQKEFSDSPPKYTLSSDERKIRRSVVGEKILLEDKFKKQKRNSDYGEDEFFSEDHLFYEDEGFLGFSDYSIVGEEFSEGGFAPYAVAIHIVFFSEKKELRIEHFVSDSNQDISDVAGKYHEAVTKLAQWQSEEHTEETEALKTFLNHERDGYYPGLPTIKKLSIMHHLELISIFLSEGSQ